MLSGSSVNERVARLLEHGMWAPPAPPTAITAPASFAALAAPAAFAALGAPAAFAPPVMPAVFAAFGSRGPPNAPIRRPTCLAPAYCRCDFCQFRRQCKIEKITKLTRETEKLHEETEEFDRKFNESVEFATRIFNNSGPEFSTFPSSLATNPAEQATLDRLNASGRLFMDDNLDRQDLGDQLIAVLCDYDV